eukprot:TRINITY_DN85502_c0_g1_i1.p1 TRINITY_DN85502_c0_g1~~TRINITY_DN85502_c0_g1_i1.p1  ORF type:complete len:173 (+),score=42.88 TRINITY_DN85502_c0_g1_i1:80-598(+)
MEQILQHAPYWLQQRIMDPTSCSGKATMASFTGFTMGIGLGVFFGTFEGAHGEIVGNTMLQQLNNGFRRSLTMTLKRSASFAPNFAVVGALLTGLECKLEKHRAKSDIWNPVIASAVAGSAFGILPNVRRGAKVMAKKGAIFGTAFVAFSLFMHYGIDYFREVGMRNQKRFG